MSKKYLLIVFLFFTYSCDILDVSDIEKYPYKINPVPYDELLNMNENFQSLNDDRICSTLNEYGFTGFSRYLFPNDVNPCLNKEVVRVEVPTPDSLLRILKEAIIRNAEYTLVKDTAALELKEQLPLFGCIVCEGPGVDNKIIEWKFTFSSQIMDNIEVENTVITVFADAHGVNRIWGNWYENVGSYGLINIGYLQAKETVKGRQFDMNEITGENFIFTVTESNIKSQPELRFLPYVNKDTLELRKTWKVPITYNEELFDGWNAYVDVYDGTLLRMETLN